MTRYFLGLGSNLGDRVATLEIAVANLPGMLRASSLYLSSPVDMESSAYDFLNLVVELEFAGEPLELLALAQALEDQAGRLRPYRNAPRTLDIDLVYGAGIAVNSESLVLPHPRAAQRLFVLVPVAELDVAIAGELAGFDFSLERFWAGEYEPSFPGQRLEKYSAASGLLGRYRS